MSPFFSICIPVYNVELYLKECLNSVCRQTFQDFEVILIDDGSTDTSGRICDQFAASNERVSVLHKKNEGLLMARRDAFSLARGRYCLCLDSDDALRDDALQVLSGVCQASPDFVSFGMSHSPDFTASEAFCPAGEYFNDKFDLIKKMSVSGRFNNLASKAICREIIDIDADYSQYKGLMLGEDWLQMLAILQKAKSCIAIEDALYWYRQREGSSTHQYRASYIGDLRSVFKRLRSVSISFGPDYFAAALEAMRMNTFALLCLIDGDRASADKVLLAKEVKTLIDEFDLLKSGTFGFMSLLREFSLLSLDRGFVRAALFIAHLRNRFV